MGPCECGQGRTTFLMHSFLSPRTLYSTGWSGLADTPALTLRHPDDKSQLTAILAACPELAAAQEHITTFADLLTRRRGPWPGEMDHRGRCQWASGAAVPSSPACRDWDAVTAGLILPWNSGVVEGHVNRIKRLKPQMYGRANPDLLRRRILLASQRPRRPPHEKWARTSFTCRRHEPLTFFSTAGAGSSCGTTRDRPPAGRKGIGLEFQGGAGRWASRIAAGPPASAGEFWRTQHLMTRMIRRWLLSMDGVPLRAIPPPVAVVGAGRVRGGFRCDAAPCGRVPAIRSVWG